MRCSLSLRIWSFTRSPVGPPSKMYFTSAGKVNAGRLIVEDGAELGLADAGPCAPTILPDDGLLPPQAVRSSATAVVRAAAVSVVGARMVKAPVRSAGRAMQAG